MDRLDLVLGYARLGWRVLPVRGGKKTPAIVGWQEKASREAEQLKRWFGNGTHYNVGVLTGTPSGFFAIDVDPRNGGDDSFGLLESSIGTLPGTVTQETAGGGWHYLYQVPEGGDIRSGKLIEYPGIDFKGTGGYIVVAPSEVGSKPYCWEESSRPGEVVIAEAPVELLRLVGGMNVIVEGTRNDTLFRHAGKLRAMGWGFPEIRDALLVMNQEQCTPPLSLAEVTTIAHSISRYKQGGLGPCAKPPQDLKRTDIGNAERLIAYHGRDLRYCPQRKTWFVWDAVRWKPDPGNLVTHRAMQTVRRIYEEASAIDDSDNREAHAKHARASERDARVKAMITLAGAFPEVTVEPKELDQDIYLVNVLNGTVDLRTLELREHQREDLITQVIPILYDPGAACPTWERFLEDVFDGDLDMIRYLQRAAGLCLSGDTTPRAFFVLYGTGHNGKSTVVETIRDGLGDYAGTIPPEELMKASRQDHGRASPFLAQLPGKRFVTAMETEENERLASALVKTMTGGRDVVTVRELYGKAFTFRPQFKLWIATNHRPRISDSTASIWGRVHMVPFRVQIPDPARGEKPDAKGRVKDPQLDAKLRAELPGILAWLVRGYRDYQERGLDPPAEVLEATQQYRAQEDVVGKFIEDRLVFGADKEATVEEFKACLADYVLYVPSVSWRNVANRLKDDTRVNRGKVRGKRGWRGVAPRGGEPHGT